MGNVDAGKSTLLGVLTHSALDDGRGLARTKLFRFVFSLNYCICIFAVYFAEVVFTLYILCLTF